MDQKVFCRKDDIVLRGDPRDIMLPAQYKLAVLSWCRKNGIVAECPLNKDNQHLARDYFGVNLWRVKDDKQRLLFILKWS